MSLSSTQTMTYPTTTTTTQQTHSTKKMNTSSSSLQPVRQIVFQEITSQEEIRQTAKIATEVFGETGRCLFPEGPNEEQVNFRTNKFDQLFIASLAFKQGIRSRPAKFMIAKDVETNKVIAFCTALVEGGGKEEEEMYSQTDQLPAQNYTPFPTYPILTNLDSKVYQAFIQSAALTMQESIGDQKVCHIKYLAVDPKIQRTGAGRSLLSLFRKEFANLPLYLEAEITPSAQQFYEKMGFKKVGMLEFNGSIRPLPCMILEPDTPSLLDQTPAKNGLTNGHLHNKSTQISQSATPTPPIQSA